MRKCRIYILVASLLVSMFIPNKLTAITATNSYEKEAIQKDKLDLWIERLAFQESKNRNDIIILDVNGKFSYSCLQFQMATFESYARRYNLRFGDNSIMDCDFQKLLARKMIEENPRNWRRWYNSTKKIGLPPL